MWCSRVRTWCPGGIPPFLVDMHSFFTTAILCHDSIGQFSGIVIIGCSLVSLYAWEAGRVQALNRLYNRYQ